MPLAACLQIINNNALILSYLERTANQFRHAAHDSNIELMTQTIH